MKMVILVGGMGTRLREVVKDVPKPMADINGRPFLAYLMESMINYGCEEFVLCVGYKREIIMNYFKDSFMGVPVKYSVEEDLLGTGGAIKQAFDLFDIDRAVILNGDTFVKMDYAKFFQQMQNEELGLSLKYLPNASRYGLVVTENDRVMDFAEKRNTNEAGFINAGIYVVAKSLFKRIAAKKFSFEKDILEKYITEIRPKYFIAEDYFIDIGIPESYKQALEELESVVRNDK